MKEIEESRKRYQEEVGTLHQQIDSLKEKLNEMEQEKN